MDFSKTKTEFCCSNCAKQVLFNLNAIEAKKLAREDGWVFTQHGRFCERGCKEVFYEHNGLVGGYEL